MTDTDRFQLTHLLKRSEAFLADWVVIAPLSDAERRQRTTLSWAEIEEWSTEANEFLVDRVPGYKPTVVGSYLNAEQIMAGVAKIVAALNAVQDISK